MKKSKIFNIIMVTVKTSEGVTVSYEAIQDGDHWWSIERGYDKRIMITLDILQARPTGQILEV